MESSTDDSVKDISPRKNLYEVFSQPDMTNRQRRNVIDALDDIDGFDIAFVISYILHFKIMGQLNIVSQSNEVSGITFGKGYIAHIDFPDKKTYLGVMLLEDGLVKKADLEEALAQKEISVGQYLISKNKLTEQQISDVVSKQMRLRLSKLICGDTFQVNFHQVEEIKNFVNIDISDYFVISHDWIAGRYDLNWLNFHFLTWQDNTIVFTPNAHKDAIFKMPMFQQLAGLEQEFEKRVTLKQLKEKYRGNETLLLKILYFLNMTDLIQLQNSSTNTDQSSNKLKNIYEELKNKKGADLVKSLSLITKVNEKNVDQIYLAFLRFVETNSDESEVEFKNELIKIGLQLLTQKPAPAGDAAGAKGGTVLTAEAIQRTVKAVNNDLLAGNYFGAMGRLKNIPPQTDIVPSVKLYHLWIRLGQAISTDTKVNVAFCETEIVQVLPEDKETAEYFYVKAMLAFLKKDKVNCEKFYQLAVKKQGVFAKHPIGPPSAVSKFLKKLGIGS